LEEAPALAIDEGRRGGRSERSDSRRVKGRQPRERERERESGSAVRASGERRAVPMFVSVLAYICTVAGLIPTRNKLLLQNTVLTERRKNRAVHLVRVSLT